MKNRRRTMECIGQVMIVMHRSGEYKQGAGNTIIRKVKGKEKTNKRVNRGNADKQMDRIRKVEGRED